MHPDDDLLADLAAGQLQGTQAERVEAHVLTCATCSDLLAGAEEMRSLLRRQPAPTMPDDVAVRLASRLGGGTPAADGRAAAHGTPAAAPSDGATGPDLTAPTRILRPVTGRRLTPMSRDTRRQQLTEERTDVRHDRWTSFGRVAAGVVAVVVLGGGAVAGARALRDSGSGSGGAGSSAASDSGGGQAARAFSAPVLATGRKYDSSGLASQVGALVADSREPAATLNSQAEGTEKAGAPATGGQRLRSASALAGCLQAIDRADQRVIAVDLATYQGREAAVIVLQQPDGSYEVWIVARDCRPGADGTIAVRTVKA